MSIVRSLWIDEQAFVASSELILISSVLVIGMLVGLTTMRDQVVQEFGDLALAVGALNQSYSYGGVSLNGFTVAGSEYDDLSDFCDGPDAVDAEPACISVQAAPGDESS